MSHINAGWIRLIIGSAIVLLALTLASTGASAAAVAEPTFSPAGGTYTTAQTVTLSSTTEGATIRYTTDGSTPSETAGTVYSAPFTVSVTTTVKAIAYASGLSDSSVSTAVYTIKAVAPAFSPAGGTYTAAQTVTLSSTTTGAMIRYTTDGSAPSETIGTVYSAPFTVSGTSTVKAIAYASGLSDSSVSTAVYTIKAVAPAFSPVGGTYTAAQTVILSSTTEGATIRYTTDGSTPSETIGTVYNAPFTVSATTTVKAIAYASGLSGSSVSTAVYTIKAAAPAFSPAGGTYTAAQTVTLSSATEGATIRYTTDGSTPSETAGTVYSAPFTVSATTTVKAIAYASGLSDSSVSTAVYTIKAVAPAFSPVGGTYTAAQTVTLSSATEGATIRYTTDGSTPSETIGTVYSAPFTVSGTSTVEAIAYASGLSDSSVSTAVYTIKAVAPAFSPVGGTYTAAQTVTLSSTTEGATIRYTTDGSTPSETAGTVYSAPFTVSATSTVKAIAYASGLSDSSVSTAVYTILTSTPAISGLSPALGPVGTAVTITGTNFGTSQGSSSVTFNGVSAGAASSWSATSITVTVPSGASTGNVVITVNGLASSGAPFTVTVPRIISSLSPTSGVEGTAVTIAGSGFGTSQGSSSVTFNGTPAGLASSWSDTSITVAVPTGASTGNVVVTVNGLASNGSPFAVTGPPRISSLSPAAAPVGAAVTITGSNFGPSQGSSTVTFNGISAGMASSWSATSIRTYVPTGATTGNVVVTVGGQASGGVSFTVTPVPAVTSVSPTPAAPGAQVTVSGTGFGTAQGSGKVWLGSTYGTVVSWSDTQIAATVALNSRSGTARVQQGGAWSNSVAFDVNTATITTVTPDNGVPGTQVTITGSGFGATQGTGRVWLGTAEGVVQSWSDTQIVAQVGAGATTGNAQVLQNGVLSNGIQFTVNGIPHITDVSPRLGVPGTSVTISGTGFGSSQAGGIVQLGSTTAGQVVSWSDTEVVATVAASALSGIARIQKDGVTSNTVGFTVPGTGGGILTLVPNVLTLGVGETHTIQALNASGQTVTGLSWASSDANVVSLSTDDPPFLTAAAAGHVTITAGSASADVTVVADAGALPPGTVIWSNPGNGSGVYSIVPAVPSSSGVADVFAFQGDGTVQAITSDGITAWTADVSQASEQPVPDFQGGLVFVENNNDQPSIVKLDGMTGQRTTLYTPGPMSALEGGLNVHPDGTVFARQQNWTEEDDLPDTVIGIDATTGTQKFSVPLPPQTDSDGDCGSGQIIAGDGYFYLAQGWMTYGDDPDTTHHLRVVRVNSSGVSDVFQTLDTRMSFTEVCRGLIHLITNADQGVVVSWSNRYGSNREAHMAVTAGGGISEVSAPQIPGGEGAVEPVLQLQDGSFVGTVGGDYMVAFDVSGNVRWSVPGYTPQIATDDGGVIATDESVAGVTFDQFGNATGHMGKLPIYSWNGNNYQIGSTIRRIPTLVNTAAGFSSQVGATRSGNWTAKASDWKGNDIVNQQKLTKSVWNKFYVSNCRAVLINTQGLGPFALDAVWQMQQKEQFYDLTRATVANWTFDNITGGAHNLQTVPDNSYRLTLGAYLGLANAATINFGAPGPILLRSGLLSQDGYEYTLVHEVLIHSYKGWTDPQVFARPWFQQNRLWDDGNGSTNITTRMSTDCKCTPGAPGDAGKDPSTGGACNPNNPNW